MSDNVVWHSHPVEQPTRAREVSVAEAVNMLLAYLHEIGALRAGYQPVEQEA